ncbi:hypothetical protein F4777DRAFT_538518 [Nemania sp. FL0916]|nr:hypothetical protein F4777DRAFT_538518 [Nemania sp. FL0916]
MSIIISPDHRRKYTLGRGVHSGFVELENGNTLWLEYDKAVFDKISALYYLHRALEVVTARACQETDCNFAQIQ